MDSVEEKLAEMEWPFVDSDPAALEELIRRVAAAGRGRGGLERLVEGHLGEDRGEPARQHGLAGARRAYHEQVVVVETPPLFNPERSADGGTGGKLAAGLLRTAAQRFAVEFWQ